MGRPDGGRLIGNTFENLYGPMALIEPNAIYELAGLPGRIGLGGWWNGDRFDRFDRSNPDPGTADESYGAYVTWEQQVFKESSETEDAQGIGLYAQYGWAPEDRSEAHWTLSGGAEWTGPIPGRDDDAMGAGVFHAAFSGEAGFADDSETAFELFYKAQIASWITVKPDIQYIVNPGGLGNRDALAIGARWELVF